MCQQSPSVPRLLHGLSESTSLTYFATSVSRLHLLWRPHPSQGHHEGRTSSVTTMKEGVDVSTPRVDCRRPGRRVCVSAPVPLLKSTFVLFSRTTGHGALGWAGFDLGVASRPGRRG